MSPSLKDITSKEVAENQRKLHESVSQLDAQINTFNTKFDILQNFIKKWWPVSVAIFVIGSGLISIGIWWVNTIITKPDVTKIEQKLNKRIDSVVRVMK